MSVVLCGLCNGKKITLGMGMMEHKCKRCKGIGYVEAPTFEEIPLKEIPLKELKLQQPSAETIVKIVESSPAEVVAVVKKKRGRPKKVKA